MLYVNPIEAFSFDPVSGAVDKTHSEKGALRELEHLFLFTLLKEMRKTADMGVEKPREVQLYEEMLDDSLSSAMAKSSQVGIASQIEQQLHAGQQSAKNEDIGKAEHVYELGDAARFIQLQSVKHLRAYADNNMDNEMKPIDRSKFVAIGSE